MEYGPHTAQRDPHTTSRSFADFGSGGPQQRLDLAPVKVGGGWFRKDPNEGATVTAVHVITIS